MADAIPDVIEAPALRDYLDVMTRAVFQAGLSWASIGKHWDDYRAAFDGFDPARVASYTEGDVDRLMRAEGVLHSARKIRATISNAAAIVEIERTLRQAQGDTGVAQGDTGVAQGDTGVAQGGAGTGFRAYLRSFADYAALAADIKKRFKFMGDMNAWYFLFRVHEPVPQFEHWVRTIPGDHPRMKEMVEKARAAGKSMECKY